MRGWLLSGATPHGLYGEPTAGSGDQPSYGDVLACRARDVNVKGDAGVLSVPPAPSGRAGFGQVQAMNSVTAVYWDAAAAQT
jgi:hypothetical protein